MGEAHGLPRCRRTSSHRRIFRWSAAGLVCAMGALLATALAASKGAESTTPATERSTNARLEFLETLRGTSGKLKAVFRMPGEPLIPQPPAGLTTHYALERDAAIVSSAVEAPQHPGVYRIAVEIDAARLNIEDLRVITLVPLPPRRRAESGRTAGPVALRARRRTLIRLRHSARIRGGNPREHLPPRLRAFHAWRLPDQRPAAFGPSTCCSTPRWSTSWSWSSTSSSTRLPRQAHGDHERIPHAALQPRGGESSGRGKLSRHMYGDATTSSWTTNRDGWTTTSIATAASTSMTPSSVTRAAELVETLHPILVGASHLPANGVHGPFTHVDARGRRASLAGHWTRMKRGVFFLTLSVRFTLHHRLQGRLFLGAPEPTRRATIGTRSARHIDDAVKARTASG